MRQRIEIWKTRFFRPVGYDENLVDNKRSFLHEMAVVWRSLGMLQGYWRWLILSIALGLLWSTISVAVPWLDKLLFDQAYPQKDWRLFLIIVGAKIFVDLQTMALNYVKDALGLFMNQRLGLWIQLHFYRHLQKLSLTLIQRRGVGEHMYRLSDDLGNVVAMSQGAVRNVILETYDLIMTFAFLGLVDKKLAAAGMAFAALNAGMAWVYTTQKRRVSFITRSLKEKSNARLQEGLAGALTVKVFGRINHEVAAYLHTVSRLMRASTLDVFVHQVYFQTLAAFEWLKSNFILFYMYYLVVKGEFSYGMIFVILAYLDRLTQPVLTLINTVNTLRGQIAPAERFFQTWDAVPAVRDRPGAKAAGALRGEIALNRVDFSYEDGSKILHGVDLKVEPGEFVALVGHSGSGKSTCLNLVMRLYDPDAGNVTVDGADLKGLRQVEYQRRLGLVMQDTFVFKGSLRENLLFSDSHASDADMLAALRQVRLDEFLRKHPEGLDADLREGAALSVGERQRLGIARALLRAPDIWLLDEPTSSLDLRTEKEIVDLIREVRAGKATLMVTHRLNTLDMVDRVCYMEGGRILEAGSLPELLARRGRFKAMHDLFHAGESVESPAPAGVAIPQGAARPA